MCGRFGNRATWTDYKATLPIVSPTAEHAPNLPERMDIRPTTQASVLRPVEGGYELRDMRWGLIPFWAGGKPLKAFKLSTFNARIETVEKAPTFREAYKRRRLVVPMTNWYEWTGEKGSKTKWSFKLKDAEMFGAAGLWDRVQTSDEGEVHSFTMLVGEAGEVSKDYHDREPIVLEPDRWTDWLNGADPREVRVTGADRFEVLQAA